VAPASVRSPGSMAAHEPSESGNPNLSTSLGIPAAASPWHPCCKSPLAAVTEEAEGANERPSSRQSRVCHRAQSRCRQGLVGVGRLSQSRGAPVRRSTGRRRLVEGRAGARRHPSPASRRQSRHRRDSSPRRAGGDATAPGTRSSEGCARQGVCREHEQDRGTRACCASAALATATRRRSGVSPLQHRVDLGAHHQGQAGEVEPDEHHRDRGEAAVVERVARHRYGVDAEHP